MVRSFVLPFLLLTAVSLWMIGCKKESSPTAVYETDEEAVRALVDGSYWLSSDDHFQDADSSSLLLSEIIPLKWWREKTQPIQRTITINQVGDSAFVTVNGKIIGVLHIWAFPADTADTLLKIQKPLEMDWTRYAIFKKTGSDDAPYRGWVLVNVSGVDAASTPTQTVDIDSVHLTGTGLDTTLTDPTLLFSIENALTFSEGDTIDVTVYTNDDSALVFLHPFRMGWRKRFENQNDGSYKGKWIIPSPTYHRVGFDLIQWETLYDDIYPHDSNVWIYPYKVQ